MTSKVSNPRLTPALEDYLETIYRLIGRHGIARVGDIAKERDVRPGSVTPAMKRLDQMGLVEYHQRDNVGLTREGEVAARKVFSRHQILTRFFSKILDLPDDLAEQNACAAEHSLSPEALDKMVRLFEYMEICPEGKGHVERFLSCSAVHDDIPPCPHACDAMPLLGTPMTGRLSIADLSVGQQGRVRQLDCQGAIRKRLLDMGMLPGSHFKVTRVEKSGKKVWVKLQGFELGLTRAEAQAVTIETE